MSAEKNSISSLIGDIVALREKRNEPKTGTASETGTVPKTGTVPDPALPESGTVPNPELPKTGTVPDPALPENGKAKISGTVPDSTTLPETGGAGIGTLPETGNAESGRVPELGKADLSDFLPVFNSGELSWSSKAMFAYLVITQQTKQLEVSYTDLSKALGFTSRSLYTSFLSQMDTCSHVDVVKKPNQNTTIIVSNSCLPKTGIPSSSSKDLNLINTTTRVPKSGNLTFATCGYILGLQPKHLNHHVCTLLLTMPDLDALFAIHYMITQSKQKSVVFLHKTIKQDWWKTLDLAEQKKITDLHTVVEKFLFRRIPDLSTDEMRHYVAALWLKRNSNLQYETREVLEGLLTNLVQKGKEYLQMIRSI